MRLRSGLFTLWAALALPAIGMAETLPLDGAYGNKDGCAYAASGESIGSDDFFLLTEEGVTTAASYCSFGKILETDGRSYRVELNCEAEGETSPSFTANVTYTVPDYTITFPEDPGVTWGPLKKCH
jgi:hypothetical protein